MIKTLEEKRKAKSAVYFQHKKSMLVSFFLCERQSKARTQFNPIHLCFSSQKLKAKASENKANEINAVNEAFGC